MHQSGLARRARRGFALLLGGWLLLLAAEAAPHLVHHLFDTPDDAACEFLAAAEHAPAAIAALDTAAPALLPARAVTLLAPALARPGETPGQVSRGPPPSPPALA
jgi:hypothetical protein